MEITKFYADVCVLLGSAVAMLFLPSLKVYSSSKMRTARPARDTIFTCEVMYVYFLQVNVVYVY